MQNEVQESLHSRKIQAKMLRTLQRSLWLNGKLRPKTTQKTNKQTKKNQHSGIIKNIKTNDNLVKRKHIKSTVSDIILGQSLPSITLDLEVIEE